MYRLSWIQTKRVGWNFLPGPLGFRCIYKQHGRKHVRSNNKEVHLSIYRTQVSVSLLFASGQRCKAHIKTLQENDKRIEDQMDQVTSFVT